MGFAPEMAAGLRRRLDKSHYIALRVLHMKPEAAVGPVLHARRHIDLMRGKILAQRLGIGGDVSQVIQPVRRVPRRQRQYLDELRRIHVVPDPVRILRIRPLEQPDIVHVILLRRLRIGSCKPQCARSR